MATASNVATSVDVLSSSERKIIVDALKAKISSLSRAIKSTSNEVVQKAYASEIVDVEMLISKFR